LSGEPLLSPLTHPLSVHGLFAPECPRRRLTAHKPRAHSYPLGLAVRIGMTVKDRDAQTKLTQLYKALGGQK
jgi:hypothetical protein